MLMRRGIEDNTTDFHKFLQMYKKKLQKEI